MMSCAPGFGCKMINAASGKVKRASGTENWRRRGRNCSAPGFPNFKNQRRCASWPCNGRNAPHREAEAKLAVLKKWDRELENRTDPLVKQVTQLHGFLTTDMGRAVAYLAQVVKALEAYADVATPGNSTGLTATADKADIAGPPGALPTGTGKPDDGKGKRS